MEVLMCSGISPYLHLNHFFKLDTFYMIQMQRLDAEFNNSLYTAYFGIIIANQPVLSLFW